MPKRSRLRTLAGAFLALFLIWVGFSLWRIIRDDAEPISALSYHEIEQRISRGSSLTEAQLAHEIAELQGKKVRWNGTVEEVDSALIVYVDMDSLLYDVRFPLDSKEAVRLSKGDHITFTGVIESIEQYWWSIRVVLRSVEIESISE